MNENSGTSTLNGNGAHDDETRSLKAYVSDMLALERHIAEPIGRQREDADVQKFPQAHQIVVRIETAGTQHVAELERTLDALGGHAASPVKSLWANLLGQAASAIDKSRRTEVSKDLRDDYTAISLATVSYSMLHATALAYGENQVAELARRGLSDYARCVMDLGRIIPGIVIDELAKDGLNLDPTVRAGAVASIEAAWHSLSRNDSSGINAAAATTK